MSVLPCPVIQCSQTVTSHYFIQLLLHLSLYLGVVEQERQGKVEGA